MEEILEGYPTLNKQKTLSHPYTCRPFLVVGVPAPPLEREKGEQQKVFPDE